MEFTPIFDENGSVVNTEELKNAILNEAQKKGFLNFNIDNPKTIQEKINWLKIYDVSYLKSKCADKIKVHEYCMEKLGEDICVPIIKIFNNRDEMIESLDKLPNDFVLKCNNTWNANTIIYSKQSIIMEHVYDVLEKKLNDNFGKKSLQLHYSLIDPKIFCEVRIGEKKCKLVDYKFWCFNGEPKFYTINSDNCHVGGTDIIYRDIDDDHDLDVYEKTNDVVYFDKPINFELMKKYSKVLSEDFKFVRVDFYEVNGRVYLGELTFTPGNGLFKYKDEKTSIYIGNMLSL